MSEMKKVFLVKYGEIALKGLNKPYFEKALIQKIKDALKDNKIDRIYKNDGITFLEVDRDENDSEIINKIKKVFGIAYISKSYEVESDIDSISEAAIEYVNDILKDKKVKTFKVDCKRGDKQFPMKSPDIASEVGGRILEKVHEIKVDVHNPEIRVYVDVRKNKSYIYSEKIQCFGGLPTGTNGKGMLLLSGGIDSPVAGWLLAKRGMQLEAIHFHSYPFTSDRAKEKVIDLAKIVSQYAGTIKLYNVNLLDIQQEINAKCPEKEGTIITRRFMMKIAEIVAKENGNFILITGESLGQVASQTIHGLVATDAAVQMPVMRPLIGMDKVDIMDVAKEIGTYDTSIMPFEDCCTVFLPKHPTTRPKLENIEESETKLDEEKLIKEALENITVEYVDYYKE